MKQRLCLTAVGALTACAASLSFAQELYRQDPQNSFGGPASQDARNPGGLGFFAETADNFPGQSGWTVGSIEFWGGYASDIPGNTEGFMIRFFDDAGGHPGNLLSTQDVMSFDEVEYYSQPIPPLGTFRGYHYSLDLGTPFVIPASGQYWMSVVAILARGGTANEPQWGWVQSTGSFPPPCEQRFFSPTFSPISGDMAFVLKSGEAPCYPDCNADGAINLSDFGCFQTKFALGDPYADCNGDSVLNLSDFGCFQTKFALGCP